jgi:hypothetical protein
MLTDEERQERRQARELLRTAANILKRAGVSQNRIAEEANYSSGYLPQLLKDQESAERLTPAAITRISTAMVILSKEAVLRLDEGSRIELRQALDRLKAGYGETRHDVVGPGEDLTPRAGNYLHRRIDNLLTQEVLNHEDLHIVGLIAAPGAGKSWTLQQLGFVAAQTHDVCVIDLSYADMEFGEANLDDESRVPRLVLKGLVRHARRLQAASDASTNRVGEDLPFSETGPVRAEDLANAILRLVDLAAGREKKVLIVIDGVDRVGEEFLLVRLMRQVQTNRWDYPGIEGALLLVAGTVVSESREDLRSSGIRPSYPLPYLTIPESCALLELWQAAGELRFAQWDQVKPDVELLAGQPKLVSELFESARVHGSLVSAKTLLQPGETGWLVLRGQFARFARAATYRTEQSERTLGEWFNDGRISISDPNQLLLKGLVKQYGLSLGDDEWVPFLVDEEIGQDLRRLLLDAFSLTRRAEQLAGQEQ